MPFRGGTLIGRNHGEFGGGLWWVARDGGRGTQLSDENVHWFVETSFGMVALTGIDHMNVSQGQAVLVAASGPLPPSISVLADLQGAPRVFVLDEAGNILVMTATQLIRISERGSETLFTTDYGLTGPTSIVKEPSGTVYVGMRHFITRLTPTGQSFEEDWLVPADCPRFRRESGLRDVDYKCLGGAPS